MKKILKVTLSLSLLSFIGYGWCVDNNKIDPDVKVVYSEKSLEFENLCYDFVGGRLSFNKFIDGAVALLGDSDSSDYLNDKFREVINGVDFESLIALLALKNEIPKFLNKMPEDFKLVFEKTVLKPHNISIVGNDLEFSFEDSKPLELFRVIQKAVALDR